jgi:hypothetical protein
MRTLLSLVALAGATAACTPVVQQTAPQPIAMILAPPAEASWRDSAAPEDIALIDDLAATWTRAVNGVPRQARALIATESALLDQGAALVHPQLSPGSYTCRAIRLDARGARAFPPQFCFIMGEADGRLSFNKQTGTDLPNGWLFTDSTKRYVFLGAQQRRAGENNIGYRENRDADRVGVVERIGPFRWRVVMPRRDGSFWVYELTPVPAERQPG